jgi:hypothetical protein
MARIRTATRAVRRVPAHCSPYESTGTAYILVPGWSPQSGTARGGRAGARPFGAAAAQSMPGMARAYGCPGAAGRGTAGARRGGSDLRQVTPVHRAGRPGSRSAPGASDHAAGRRPPGQWAPARSALMRRRLLKAHGGSCDSAGGQTRSLSRARRSLVDPRAGGRVTGPMILALTRVHSTARRPAGEPWKHAACTVQPSWLLRQRYCRTRSTISVLWMGKFSQSVVAGTWGPHSRAFRQDTKHVAAAAACHSKFATPSTAAWIRGYS